METIGRPESVWARGLDFSLRSVRGNEVSGLSFFGVGVVGFADCGRDATKPSTIARCRAERGEKTYLFWKTLRQHLLYGSLIIPPKMNCSVKSSRMFFRNMWATT